MGITALTFFIVVIQGVNCAYKDLYNTKSATSDLKWTAYPDFNGWEEVSGLDTEANTIRYNQVCNMGSDEPQDNWVRSPFISADNANLVYLDIEYSMMKCDDCRETFTLYYYESSSDVASSTFPPWKEIPYKKIDKVAAGNRFNQNSQGSGGINQKTFTIGPLRRKGLYIAAQDQGACMSLMSVRVYYYYCPETTYDLAYFPSTIAGEEVSSLIPVNGKCVSNAVYGMEVPKYRCNSKGGWKVPTGSCECRSGYQPNGARTACQACPSDHYKTSKGNRDCVQCPPYSTALATGASVCHCTVGYYRAKQDTVDQGCTRPPSRPRNVTAVVNKTTAILSWQKPKEDGGRKDPHYSITCQECSADYEECWSCKNTIQFNPLDTRHITQTNAVMQGLQLYKYYKIKIAAKNGVSSVSKEPESYEIVTFSTNDAVPSVVQSITLQSSSSSSLSLSWRPPSRLSNIVTGYEVFSKKLTSEEPHARPTAPKHAPTVLKVWGLNCSVEYLEASTYYEIKVRALSKEGPGQYSEPTVFKTATEEVVTPAPQDTNSIPIFAAIGAIVLILVAIVIIALVLKKRKNNSEQKKEQARMRAKMGNEEGDPLNPDLVVLLPPMSALDASRTYVDYRDPHKGVKEQHTREIKNSNVKIEKIIGKGEFGEVCKGKLVEGKKETPVAVKRLRNGVSLVDQTNFLREACTMAQFKHNNILELKGVVTKSIPPMIISEFMENGSLDSFLKKNEGKFTLIDLLKMLRGIASGMRYLSQMQYVHRDLAARNILVSQDLTCKVSDFGLSRTFENDPRATYTTQGGKIPIRWTAPECFRCRQFTSSSDVWSFGIVMWEVMSYGEKPYWEMKNEDVTESIEKGYRLPAPPSCPLVIHQLMLDCWSYEAANRPTFDHILEQLHSFINNPDMLLDCGPATADSGSLVNPESPTFFKFDDWLEVMNLSNYKQQFKEQGFGNLEDIVRISESDIERLGIAEPVLRDRLQSGIETLRRHRGSPNSPSSLTLPSGASFNRDTAVAFSTTPRGASASAV